MTYPAPQNYQTQTQSNDNMMAALIHILPIFTSFIAPLIFFIVYKDQNTVLREHSRRALNFSLLVIVAAIGITVGVVIMTFITLGLLGFLTVLTGIPYIAAIVFGIIAGVQAYEGKLYKYPVTVEWVK